MFVRIGDFRDLHVGATAYVVGKGPSLQWLKADHFGEGPVITINESIGKVESLNLPNKVYSFYKDGCKVYDSRPDSYFMAPHRCTLPLSTRNAPTFVHDFEAPHCFTQYHNRVGFDNRRDFGISPLIPSAPTIVSFVKLLGCRKIVWLCMDSFVTGDIGSYGSDANGECRYLNRQSSYYQHRAKVYSELERLGIEHEWVLPESEAQPSGKIKLLIATPFYPFFGYSGYIRSLFQLSVLLSQVPQIEFNFLELTGHCYVDNVRNVISSRFLQSDYTDLLFYDSDMEIDAIGFSHLLMRQEEVVGAVYRRKNDWEKYNGEIFINPDRTPVVSESGLIKAKILPTGLMKIKRTVFEKMAQHYVDDFYYTPNYTEQGEPLAPSMVHNFFGNIIDKETRSYHGEDSSFCIRWQAMGGELWLEPKITITHYGLKGYEGNFHDYLTKLPGGSNHKPSNTVVEDIWEKCDYRRGSAGERYADRFLDYVPHGATVNDYGSGTGRGTVAIKKLRPDVTVNMVDIARNALEYETMELMGHGVTFTFSDLSRLPEDFPVSDWGYCVGVMMLLEGEALDNAMLEMRRTCRNLFMEVYDYPDWRLGEDRTKTKQPASWWREKLSELWEQVTYLENFDVPGRYVFVCRSEACAEPQYRKKLNAIFYFNGSDKGYFGHCYGDFYETLLKPFVGKKIRLLEIGLNENDNQHIPSLLAWREYLGERAEIVGLDIRDFRHMAQPGMAIEMGDQRDVECLDNLASKYGPFDIIIDDGSHDPDDQIASFRHLWWCLNPGGVYAIEDLLSPRNDALVKYLGLMNNLTMTLHQSSSGQQKLLCIRKE